MTVQFLPEMDAECPLRQAEQGQMGEGRKYGNEERKRK